MAKPEIIIYDEKYRLDLAELLQQMSKELYGTGTVNIEAFVKRHWAIYLAIVDDKVVGVSSYTFNDYCGLRLPTMGNTYLYMTPEYRNSKAMYLLGAQFGKVSESTNLPIETYYASDKSRLLGKRMKSTFLYDVHEYAVEDVKVAFDRLKKYIPIT